VDIRPTRPPEASPRELQQALSRFEWQQLLHCSFTECSLTNDYGPTMILQARRHNFRRARCGLIDENCYRQSLVAAVFRRFILLV
jgi:hypothetical protein